MSKSMDQDSSGQSLQEQVISFVEVNSPTDPEEVFEVFSVLISIQDAQNYLDALATEGFIDVDREDPHYPVYIGSGEI